MKRDVQQSWVVKMCDIVPFVYFQINILCSPFKYEKYAIGFMCQLSEKVVIGATFDRGYSMLVNGLKSLLDLVLLIC